METIFHPKPHAVVLLLLGLQLSACSTWQPRTVSPQEVIDMEQPSRVRITVQARLIEEAQPALARVTLTDESQIVLRNPTVTNGMIIGTTDAGPVVRFLLGDVQTIEIQELSALRTAALSGSIALVSTLFIVLLRGLSGSPGG